MQRYQDSVLIQGVSSATTVVGAGLTVRVYNAGTTILAPIYSDNVLTVIPQATTPIVTDVNGAFEFYAANGRYDITISGTAIATITRPDVLLEDLATFFGGNYADNSGTPDALVATYPNAITPVLADGYPLEVDSGLLGTNTGAVTVAVTLKGVLQAVSPVVKYNGVGDVVPLVAGDLPKIAQLRWSAPLAAYILLNPVNAEYQSISVATTAVNLTSGVTATITSLTLSVGDWDIDGVVEYLPTGTTSITSLVQGTSPTAATLDAVGTYTGDVFPARVTGASILSNITPLRRLKAAVPTTIYLVARAIFSASTLTAGGLLQARRRAQ